MEEGMMISRLSRSNQNFAIIVDVGDLYGEEVFDYLDKYKKRINRRRYIDPTTGHISYKFNPLSVFEDLLIPTRQGSGSNVVSLNSGATATKGIEDIHYFQNKLIYANGVPKLLIGKEEDVNSKATSDVQYISFLRNIRRIQTLVESEIIRFYQTALATMGVENADLYVEWPVIGTIDEERKWRIELMKMQVAQMMGKDLSLVDDMYIYMNLMGMSEKEANELITRMDKEEEEAAAEFDVQVDDAEDQTEDPYEDKPELAPGEKPKPAAKKAPAKKPSKEQEYYDKLGPARYEVFTRMRKAMEKNAEFKKVVLEFVQLTQAKLGE
jgi:hypothetical protein